MRMQKPSLQKAEALQSKSTRCCLLGGGSLRSTVPWMLLATGEGPRCRMSVIIAFSTSGWSLRTKRTVSCCKAMVLKPLGKHSVSVVDVEVPTRYDGGVLFRLYYPSERAEADEKIQWMPSVEYARGYVGFMNMLPKWLDDPVAWLIYKAVGQTRAVDMTLAAQIATETAEKLPVIVYSHGLGANRTSYSLLCRDLASDGSLVVSVEHRDGSASASLVTDEENGTRSYLGYQRAQRQWSEEENYEFRQQMLRCRIGEITRSIDYLRAINNGQSDQPNLLGSSAVQNILSSLRDRIDLTSVALVGHSFGGATVLQAAYELPERYSCCAALDPWFHYLNPKLKSPDGPPLGIPLLIIKNERHGWPKNIVAVENVVNRSVRPAEFYTLCGAVHQAQSDFGVLLGPRLARVFRLTSPGGDLAVLELNDALLLRFTRKYLGSVSVSELPELNTELLLAHKSPEQIPGRVLAETKQSGTAVNLLRE